MSYGQLRDQILIAKGAELPGASLPLPSQMPTAHVPRQVSRELLEDSNSVAESLDSRVFGNLEKLSVLKSITN